MTTGHIFSRGLKQLEVIMTKLPRTAGGGFRPWPSALSRLRSLLQKKLDLQRAAKDTRPNLCPGNDSLPPMKMEPTGGSSRSPLSGSM